MRTCCYLLLSLIFLAHSYGQTDSMGSIEYFVPRERIIFQDDFNMDKVDSFPAKWHAGFDEIPNIKKYCRVRDIGASQVLSVINYPKGNNFLSLHRQLDPNMPKADYLPDSFTLEFDFMHAGDSSFMGVYFYATAEKKLMPLTIYKSFSYGWVLTFSDNWELAMKQRNYRRNLPGFASRVWHHFALSYYKQAVRIYLDHSRIATFKFKYAPSNFSMVGAGLDSTLHDNFRLATGPLKRPAFDDILTKKTFTTHAILFDVNKAVIKDESMAFIGLLASWLKENAAVNLEIDGHTDSDGDAVANMKLSQQRADEVKKQLAACGIDSSRLTTKGYGDSKPIKPNTTPEGKTENRRVEFIRK